MSKTRFQEYVSKRLEQTVLTIIGTCTLCMSASVHAAPSIAVSSDSLSNETTLTQELRVRLTPDQGRQINFRSLKIVGHLGIFKRDITKVVLENSEIVGNQIIARSPDIPVGNHRVSVAVTDDIGDSASQDYRVSVSERRVDGNIFRSISVWPVDS